MRRLMSIVGLCAFTLAPLRLLSDEAESLFHQANKLYEQGDYAEAAQVYEQIVASGQQSWQLYYNLGNAYYKMNETGMAILNYERAARLNPENEDIQFNLDLANLAIVDRIPTPPKPEFVRWVEGFVFAPAFNTLVWLMLAFYAIFLLSRALGYVKPDLQRNRLLRILKNTSLPLFVVFLIWFSFRWYKIETEQFAIVLAAEVSVTSSPTADATQVFALHEGTKLKIEQLSGEWARIRLQDGKIGWLPVKALGVI